MKKHTHVIFSFTNGEELRYNDVRKVWHDACFSKEDRNGLHTPLNKLGPEPFDEAFTFRIFSGKITKNESRHSSSSSWIKRLSQGLGNIYVDETLFKAGFIQKDEQA